jgi:hypothetical protein
LLTGQLVYLSNGGQGTELATHEEFGCVHHEHRQKEKG